MLESESWVKRVNKLQEVLTMQLDSSSSWNHFCLSMDVKLTEEIRSLSSLVSTRISYTWWLNSSSDSTQLFLDKFFTRRLFINSTTLHSRSSQLCGSPYLTSNTREIDQISQTEWKNTIRHMTRLKETTSSSWEIQPFTKSEWLTPASIQNFSVNGVHMLLFMLCGCITSISTHWICSHSDGIVHLIHTVTNSACSLADMLCLEYVSLFPIKLSSTDITFINHTESH